MGATYWYIDQVKSGKIYYDFYLNQVVTKHRAFPVFHHNVWEVKQLQMRATHEGVCYTSSKAALSGPTSNNSTSRAIGETMTLKDFLKPFLCRQALGLLSRGSLRICWRYYNFLRVISSSVFWFYFAKILCVRCLLLVFGVWFIIIIITIKLDSRWISLAVKSGMREFRKRQHSLSLMLDRYAVATAMILSYAFGVIFSFLNVYYSKIRKLRI